jgi:arylsulfatase
MKHAGPTEPFVHNETPVKSVPDGYYDTDAFVDHAVGQIQKLSRGGRPFFLHLAFTAPHYPMQAPREDIERYRGRYREGYGVLRQERFRRLQELNLLSKDWKLPEPDRKLGDWRYDLEPTAWDALPDKDWESAKMEVYAGMVDRMDQGIGRVMDALKASGIEDNTLVIFFSDNGGCGSNSSSAAYKAYKNGASVGDKESYILCGPGWATAQSSPFRRYKTWTYEGGISTPMIVRWPGRINADTVTHAEGHVVDLMPTFMEIAGVTYPRQFAGNEILPMEGESLTSVLFGGGGNRKRELGWYLYGSRAYRSGKWKIVWGVTAKHWELYDMESDRTETHDLAAEHPDLVGKLSAAWREWADRSEVPQ